VTLACVRRTGGARAQTIPSGSGRGFVLPPDPAHLRKIKVCTRTESSHVCINLSSVAECSGRLRAAGRQPRIVHSQEEFVLLDAAHIIATAPATGTNREQWCLGTLHMRHTPTPSLEFTDYVVQIAPTSCSKLTPSADQGSNKCPAETLWVPPEQRAKNPIASNADPLRNLRKRDRQHRAAD